MDFQEFLGLLVFQDSLEFLVHLDFQGLVVIVGEVGILEYQAIVE